MKEKRWIDCPICGAKTTMKHRSGISEKIKREGYKPFVIGDLEGQFCTKCGEGFLSIKSKKSFYAQYYEEIAKQDSEKTLVSEVMEVKELADILGVTKQRVHQMMQEGKVPSVFFGKNRMPKRLDRAAVNKIKKGENINIDIKMQFSHS